MKILIINSSDQGGGAAKAATRFFDALQHNGMDAKMMVHQKTSANNNIVAPVVKPLQILQSRLEKYLLKLKGIKSLSYFSIGKYGNDITGHSDFVDADIINIHWVNRGFLSIKNIADIFSSGKKVIWTLHDSWAFTGGCHLPYDCLRYQEHCGQCPALASHQEHDLSYEIFKNKQQQWGNLSAHIVAPSNWLAQKARGSSLFAGYPVSVFPNTLNTAIFKPHHREEARASLGLPLDKKLILFGAVSALQDQNKGFSLLHAALHALIDQDAGFAQTHALCVFGSNDRIDLPMETFALGHIGDETSMAKLYSAADVFVLPSKSENLPYTIMESMACGTPAVAFKVGGIPELISHKQNGYLAQCYDTADLARGISETLKTISPNNQQISQAISSKYGYEAVARQLVNFLNA